MGQGVMAAERLFWFVRLSISKALASSMSGRTNRAAAAANTQGGGSGGGGGVAILSAETYTNDLGTIRAGGGGVGQITAPYISLTNNDPGVVAANTIAYSTGSTDIGVGGSIAVTGLTTGGMDAAKVTITGGAHYVNAPGCTVVANGSGITGATCHVTVSGGAINAIVFDTAGSGGTFSSFTTAGTGGYGGDGFAAVMLIQ